VTTRTHAGTPVLLLVIPQKTLTINANSFTTGTTLNRSRHYIFHFIP
jgi:hypothetical protein